MKLVERVAHNYKHLSENDIIIWNYISNNLKKCETLSIENLASYCHVSKTTVLRFAKRIGLSGYSELKMLLRMENNIKISYSSYIDVVQTGYNEYIENLKNKDLKTVIKVIHKAKNVYIYARGSIQRSVADEMYRTFLPLDKLFFRIKTLGETSHYEQNITKKDVVIILSYSGETEDSIKFVKKLKLKGTKVIGVTVTKYNTLQNIADYRIYIEPVAVRANKGISYNCLAEYFILIDILFVTYLDYLESLEETDEH